MLRFNCSNCGKSFVGDADMAGKLIACPGCQIWMLVPKRGLDDPLAAGRGDAVQQGAVELSAAANVAVMATTLEQPKKQPPKPRLSLIALVKRVFTQRVIILLGLGLLSFMACCVPWLHVDNQGVELGTAGYHFIFNPPIATHYGVKVDLARAVIPMLFVMAVTVAIAFLRGGPPTDQGSNPTEEEKARLVTRVEICKPVLAPREEDVETWPN